MGGAVAAAVRESALTLPEGKSPDEILKSNKRNKELHYSTISRVQIGRRLMANRVYVHTVNEVYKFKIRINSLDYVEGKLRKMLPHNIAVERTDKLG